MDPQIELHAISANVTQAVRRRLILWAIRWLIGFGAIAILTHFWSASSWLWWVTPRPWGKGNGSFPASVMASSASSEASRRSILSRRAASMSESEFFVQQVINGLSVGAVYALIAVLKQPCPL